jgi:hypothetical protein
LYKNGCTQSIVFIFFSGIKGSPNQKKLGWFLGGLTRVPTKQNNDVVLELKVEKERRK